MNNDQYTVSDGNGYHYNIPITPPEENVEEVVLSRWEKFKKWFEIAMATKKVMMFLWALVFGVGGTAMYGTITETNPLRDAAIKLGIVDPSIKDRVTESMDNIYTIIDVEIKSLHNEINTLEKDLSNLQKTLDDHKHDYLQIPKQVSKAELKEIKELKTLVESHTHTLADTPAIGGLDEAFSRHIKDDH